MSETTFDPVIWAFPLPDRGAKLFRQLWAFGFEPKGRTFDEIDSRHDAFRLRRAFGAMNTRPNRATWLGAARPA
jgi:hypothetical protein